MKVVLRCLSTLGIALCVFLGIGCTEKKHKRLTDLNRYGAALVSDTAKRGSKLTVLDDSEDEENEDTPEEEKNTVTPEGFEDPPQSAPLNDTPVSEKVDNQPKVMVIPETKLAEKTVKSESEKHEEEEALAENAPETTEEEEEAITEDAPKEDAEQEEVLDEAEEDHEVPADLMQNEIADKKIPDQKASEKIETQKPDETTKITEGASRFVKQQNIDLKIVTTIQPNLPFRAIFKIRLSWLAKHADFAKVSAPKFVFNLVDPEKKNIAKVISELVKTQDDIKILESKNYAIDLKNLDRLGSYRLQLESANLPTGVGAMLKKNAMPVSADIVVLEKATKGKPIQVTLEDLSVESEKVPVTRKSSGKDAFPIKTVGLVLTDQSKKELKFENAIAWGQAGAKGNLRLIDAKGLKLLKALPTEQEHEFKPAFITYRGLTLKPKDGEAMSVQVILVNKNYPKVKLLLE